MNVLHAARHAVLAGLFAPLLLAGGCASNGESTSTGGAGGSGGTGGSSGGSGGEFVVECDTVAPRACNFPELTYTNDIKPIIDDTCLACHLGEPDGPWTLEKYEHVVSWHDLIRAVMLNCEMPPPEDRVRMTTEDRQLILEWLRCGFPE